MNAKPTRRGFFALAAGVLGALALPTVVVAPVRKLGVDLDQRFIWHVRDEIVRVIARELDLAMIRGEIPPYPIYVDDGDAVFLPVSGKKMTPDVDALYIPDEAVKWFKEKRDD